MEGNAQANQKTNTSPFRALAKSVVDGQSVTQSKPSPKGVPPVQDASTFDPYNIFTSSSNSQAAPKKTATVVQVQTKKPEVKKKTAEELKVIGEVNNRVIINLIGTGRLDILPTMADIIMASPDSDPIALLDLATLIKQQADEGHECRLKDLLMSYHEQFTIAAFKKIYPESRVVYAPMSDEHKVKLEMLMIRKGGVVRKSKVTERDPDDEDEDAEDEDAEGNGQGKI